MALTKGDDFPVHQTHVSCGVSNSRRNRCKLANAKAANSRAVDFPRKRVNSKESRDLWIPLDLDGTSSTPSLRRQCE